MIEEERRGGKIEKTHTHAVIIAAYPLLNKNTF
jgi:hypothetical protein